jgi:hypothetical protein
MYKILKNHTLIFIQQLIHFFSKTERPIFIKQHVFVLLLNLFFHPKMEFYFLLNCKNLLFKLKFSKFFSNSRLNLVSLPISSLPYDTNVDLVNVFCLFWSFINVYYTELVIALGVMVVCISVFSVYFLLMKFYYNYNSNSNTQKDTTVVTTDKPNKVLAAKPINPNSPGIPGKSDKPDKDRDKNKETKDILKAIGEISAFIGINLLIKWFIRKIGGVPPGSPPGPPGPPGPGPDGPPPGIIDDSSSDTAVSIIDIATKAYSGFYDPSGKTNLRKTRNVFANIVKTFFGNVDDGIIESIYNFLFGKDDIKPRDTSYRVEDIDEFVKGLNEIQRKEWEKKKKNILEQWDIFDIEWNKWYNKMNDRVLDADAPNKENPDIDQYYKDRNINGIGVAGYHKFLREEITRKKKLEQLQNDPTWKGKAPEDVPIDIGEVPDRVRTDEKAWAETDVVFSEDLSSPNSKRSKRERAALLAKNLSDNDNNEKIPEKSKSDSAKSKQNVNDIESIPDTSDYFDDD